MILTRQDRVSGAETSRTLKLFVHQPRAVPSMTRSDDKASQYYQRQPARILFQEEGEQAEVNK